MKFSQLLSKCLSKKLRARLGYGVEIRDFEFDPSKDVAADITAKYGFEDDLLDLFVNNKERPVHKWHHYIPIYDRYFSRFRGTNVRFLEIGVFRGGSLQMWRNYFGDKATIFGIDSDPNCASLDGDSGSVRIGSQDDAEFLNRVIEEMGGVDIVLDDGSHQMKHLIKTFRTLFPLLNQSGVYMAEDLCTSYWRSYGGGYGRRANFFSFLSRLMNDMHHWWHVHPINYPDLSDMISGIHMHDSIAVFEKGKAFRPTHSEIPRSSIQ